MKKGHKKALTWPRSLRAGAPHWVTLLPRGTGWAGGWGLATRSPGSPLPGKIIQKNHQKMKFPLEIKANKTNFKVTHE